MQLRALFLAGAFSACALLHPDNDATAQQPTPYELSAIISLTGALTFSGQGERQAIQIIEGIVNQTGGIQHHPLKVTFYDDQSNPEVAVQLANAVIAKGQAAFLGPILTANCRAVAALIEKAGPVGYCFSPGYTPTTGSFAFSAAGNSFDESQGFLRYFHSQHWDRVAILATTDATGQAYTAAYTHNVTLPEFAGMTMVATERMAVGDINVTAQLQRIKAARPDILMLAMSGAPGGTVLRDMRDVGLDAPIGTGLQNMVWAQQFPDALPKMISFAGRVGMSIEDTPKGAVRNAQSVFFDGYKAAGKPVTGDANLAWDPSWILINAIRHFGPTATAAQIHDYIENLHGFAGINGLYDFRTGDQRGLEDKSVKVFRWNDLAKRFVAVSGPGGVTKL
jgi:branched-chain amino acid transport system substrate-binding protein